MLKFFRPKRIIEFELKLKIVPADSKLEQN